jgi:membrane protein implicated in regulation of membrane protease activity
MADVRALLVGIIGGLITYYAAKIIDRYLARRTIRSRQRQIEQLAKEIQLLERLGVTDRALLLFAFKMLFPLIGVAAVGVALSVARPCLSAPADDPTQWILLMFSVVIAIMAFSATNVIQKLEDPEPSLAKLRQKMRELQGTDDPPPPG